jgi:hypothetical protein
MKQRRNVDVCTVVGGEWMLHQWFHLCMSGALA